LARAGHQCEVVILNVQPASSDAETAERSGKGIIEQANEFLASQNIRHISHVFTGNPADVILSSAQRFQIDLIVMGTRGLGLLASVILGSIATHTWLSSRRSQSLLSNESHELRSSKAGQSGNSLFPRYINFANLQRRLALQVTAVVLSTRTVWPESTLAEFSRARNPPT
jgi:hypothetical protein